MDNKSNPVLRNESGAALVVALLMIVVLSLIGIASSSNSTFEIRLSGNKRGATDAFYAADAGLVSVTANTGNFNASYDADERKFKVNLDLGGNWDSVTKSPDNFNSFGFLNARQELKTEFANQMLIRSAPPNFWVSFDVQPEVVRMLVDKAAAPRGLGMSALAFKYNYFIIGSTGYDQLDLSLVRSNCEIREKIVRLIPTDQGGY